METSIRIPFCRALVDQGRTIGTDPVGYACTKPATALVLGFPLCDDCRLLLAREPSRVFIQGQSTLTWENWVEYDRIKVQEAVRAMVGTGKTPDA